MTSADRREVRYRRRKEIRESKKCQKTFEEVFSLYNMCKSLKKCLTGVGWKASTQRVRLRQLTTLSQLYNSLHRGTYKSKPFYKFELKERGKKREIQATHITERIVQKCLCKNLLWDIITPSIVVSNSASQKGRGVTYARNRFKQHMKRNKEYVLTYDIHSFFASIRHDKAKEMFQKKIADIRILSLCNQLIDEFDGDIGVGLGSEISQVIAIYYLNKIDHLGESYGDYGRYMDDGYLFSSKQGILEFLTKSEPILEELGMELNGKTQLKSVYRGAVFLKRMHKKEQSSVVVVLVSECRRRIIKRVNKLLSIPEERREIAYQAYRALISETDENKSRFKQLF